MFCRIEGKGRELHGKQASVQDEAIDKFIIGAWDVNDDAVWEEYVETMKSLGVDTMIEIYTAALERYNAR